jgi:hypothetical protein
LKTRLIIWITGCLALSTIAFGELWAKLPRWLSPEGLQQYGVSQWVILALCMAVVKEKRYITQNADWGF